MEYTLIEIICMYIGVITIGVIFGCSFLMFFVKLYDFFSERLRKEDEDEF